MKMNFLRRLALLCAVLTCGMLLALPAAAAEADAPPTPRTATWTTSAAML